MEGITLEKLQVIIDAYTKPYRDELEKVKQKTDSATRHVEKQTGRIRNAFKQVGRSVMAALGIGAIITFGKSCIDLGSDLQEVQNVIDVTFGSMSESVDAFAKNAIAQFGLSETMAKRYMGTYGAMAKAFGYTTQQAYSLSASITGLTGDVASFYNITQDEAYTKLKSIFTGETESLKDLGVVMTQTALDQYALNNGFGKTTASMTEQEKVMLRYQFVMSQLSAAQGDFARTSDGWANQIRVLQLRFESLKATIGQGFINALTPVIQALNKLLEKLQTVAEYFKAFTEVLFGKSSESDAIGGAADALDSAQDSAGLMADNMQDTAKAAKEITKQLAKFDELNVLNTKDSSNEDTGFSDAMFPDMSAIGAGNDLGEETAGIIDKITAALDRLKEIAKPTTDAIMKLWNEGLKQLGNFTWGTIQDFWENFLKPMGTWMLSDSAGLPRFFNITNDLLNEIDWPRLRASLAEFYEALQKPAKFVWTGLMDFYEYFLKPVAVWTMGVGLPQLIDALTMFVNKIHWEEINAALANFWKALAPFATAIGQGLINFFKDLLSVGADFINAVVPAGLNGLADALNKIDPSHAEKIGYALGIIVTALTGLKFIGNTIDLVEKLVKIVTKSKIAKGIVFLKDGLLGLVTVVKSSSLVEMFSIVAGGAGTMGEAFEVCFPKTAALISAVKGLGPALVSVFQNLNPAMISQLAITITDFIRGTVLDPFSWDNFIGEFLRYLAGSWSRLWDGVLELLSNFGETFKKAIKKIFDLTWVKELFEKAKQNLLDAFNGKEIGKNIVEGLFNGLFAALGVFLAPIVNLFTAIVEGVAELLGIHSPSTVFQDFGKNIVFGLFNGLSGEWKKITAWVKTAVLGMIDGFKELPQKLKEAGMQAINGFIDGLKSKWESLKNTVKGLADSATKGFRDALDIHSPSRVTAKIAEFFVDGFNFRIRDKIPESQEYTREWAAKISDVKVQPASVNVARDEELMEEPPGQYDEETKKLLREQNDLLRMLIAKPGITTRQMWEAWKQEAAEYKKRTGRDPVFA